MRATTGFSSREWLLLLFQNWFSGHGGGEKNWCVRHQLEFDKSSRSNFRVLCSLSLDAQISHFPTSLFIVITANCPQMCDHEVSKKYSIDVTHAQQLCSHSVPWKRILKNKKHFLNNIKTGSHELCCKLTLNIGSPMLSSLCWLGWEKFHTRSSATTIFCDQWRYQSSTE